jgi:signal transduction histidine kinase
MSLQTRFIIYVTFLLSILAGLILFVIEKREVNAKFMESKNRGILIAKHIANLNLNYLIFWDLEAIEENIEDQIDEELIYVVIYDRFNEPVAANDFIRDYGEIYGESRLKGEITEQSSFFESKDIKDKSDNQILRILEIEVPIFTKGSPKNWGSIKIGLSLADMRREVQRTRFVLILIGFVGLLIGIFGATLLARRITGPLKKLVGGTVKISKGDFAHEIDIPSQDEIGDLAKSFNKMSRELLQTREKMEEANIKLIQAEKLASIGRISATIAHEIRNPLTSVKLNIQKVSQSAQLDEIEEEHLKISQEGVGQIEKFIKEFLDFTRISELNLAQFPVDQILEESIKMMSDFLAQKKVILEKKFRKKEPLALVDGDKLRQVFLNILRNAYEAVDEGGKISVSLSLKREEESRKIRVVISDNGRGIPMGDWENIFEPFYTTKSSGTGLGLAIARKIIEQHRGFVRVIKREGRGTSFEVLIPCGGEK